MPKLLIVFLAFISGCNFALACTGLVTGIKVSPIFAFLSVAVGIIAVLLTRAKSKA